MTDAPTPTPGWYPDPDGPGQRYWDGGSWTESYSAPAPPPYPAYAHPAGLAQPVAHSGVSGLVVTGYVMALLFPVAGLVLGIVAATRDDRATSKHGIWIMVLSLVLTALTIIGMIAFFLIFPSLPGSSEGG